MEKEFEECIKNGREVEDFIKKLREEARLEKLAVRKEYKKKVKKDKDEEMGGVKRKYAQLYKDLYQHRDFHIQFIPRFWSTAFRNFAIYRDLLSIEDRKITKFLSSLHLQDGHEITFVFDNNPYFQNPSLTLTFSETPRRIRILKGTHILWKDPLLTEDFQKKSFFTRFFDPQPKDCSKKLRKEVIEEIKLYLWPDALDYFLNAAFLECREITAVEEKFEKMGLPHQVVIVQKLNKVLQPLYQKRNEIFREIPNFWLLAFLNHYALGDLLRDDDQKIFRFVESMEVEDDEDGVSGYIITLNFNDNNPYFTNRSLTKRISFSKDGTTNLSAVEIEWKVKMNIATRFLDDTLRIETSFFTWFCAPQVLGEGYSDEVSELIKDEIWPNALEYFVNGNEEDDE